MQKSYLNLGAGRIILPGDKPGHHALVPDAIYSYPLWLNVDRNPAPGIDCVMDLFTYPWPLEDNAYDGVLLSHLIEHIPHEIKLRHYEQEKHERSYEEQVRPSEGVWQTLEIRYPSDEKIAHARRMDELTNMQDGWFAFWAELYRVLTPGAQVHVLAPYATSHGFLGDPTHTRPIVEQSFQHSMKPDPNAPFEYATGGIHFEVKRFGYEVMPRYMGMMPIEGDTQEVIQVKNEAFDTILHTHLNVVNTLYCYLECVK